MHKSSLNPTCPGTFLWKATCRETCPCRLGRGQRKRSERNLAGALLHLGRGRWKRADASQYLAGGLLHKNVQEKLKDLLDRKRTCLPFVEESTVQSASAALPASQEKGSLGEAATGEHEKNTAPVNKAVPDQLDEGGSSRPMTAPEWRRKLNREKRHVLYEEVRALRRQGFSHYAIADALGISRPTVLAGCKRILSPS
jgi:hypothetical protein